MRLPFLRKKESLERLVILPSEEEISEFARKDFPKLRQKIVEIFRGHSIDMYCKNENGIWIIGNTTRDITIPLTYVKFEEQDGKRWVLEFEASNGKRKYVMPIGPKTDTRYGLIRNKDNSPNPIGVYFSNARGSPDSTPPRIERAYITR